MKDNDIMNMFWTGGWDSTYMLIEQLKYNKTIRPIYIIDKKRKGMSNEINAMNVITEKIKDKNGIGGVLLPIETINIEDIPINEKITNSYKQICTKVKLGTQYDWLARVALLYPKVAIGIEKPNGEFSGCVQAINEFGKMKYNDEIGYIDKDFSTEECIQVFGNMVFPIVNKTEIEMIENVKLWGLEDIMKDIWFCHKPIKGKTCGMCRPCQQKMQCKMEFLLDDSAQKRYYKYYNLKNRYGDFVGKCYSELIHIIK